MVDKIVCSVAQISLSTDLLFIKHLKEHSEFHGSQFLVPADRAPALETLMKSLKLEDICPCSLVLSVSRHQALSHPQLQFWEFLPKTLGRPWEGDTRGPPQWLRTALARMGLGCIALCISRMALGESSVNVGGAGCEGITGRWYGGMKEEIPKSADGAQLPGGLGREGERPLGYESWDPGECMEGFRWARPDAVGNQQVAKIPLWPRLGRALFCIQSRSAALGLSLVISQTGGFDGSKHPPGLAHPKI